MVSENNILIKQFDKWLLLNYSNRKTRELYASRGRWFLDNIEKRTGKEPNKITQDMFDEYLIYLRQKPEVNSFYLGFIKAWRECFDPEDGYGRRHFAFKIPKNKSRQTKTLDEYDWLEKESVDKIINEADTYISLTTQIFFETGLREMELINADLSKKPTDEIGIKEIDFTKRRLIGMGKGNKEFSVPISKNCAERLEVWLTECVNPKRPFIFYKRSGTPYKNMAKTYWYKLKKETNKLGIKLTNGKDVHPHCIEAKAKILTLNGWKSHNEIKKGEMVLTYNIKRKKIEIQPILNIYKYNYNDYAIKLKRSKLINTILTPEHKLIIKICRRIGEKWKKKGKDIWNENYKIIPISYLLENKKRIPFKTYKKAQNIRNIKMLVSARKENNKSTIGIYKAGLLGWILTDGCIYWHKKRNVNITISQSWNKNKHKCNIIENLLKKAKLKYTKHIGKKITRTIFHNKYTYEYQPCLFRISNVNPKCKRNYYLKDKNISWIFKYLTRKKRPINKTLLQLNYRELKSLHEAMMLGDGSRDQEFTTQNKKIIDFFRIISTLLGYRTTLGYGELTYKKGKKYRIYLCKRKCPDKSTPDSIQLLKKHFKKIKYKGIVWCPETKNHTWIAKDNETIFITGNSYRHSVLRWLRREKGWDIETLAKYGRHEDPKTTMIYSGATSEEVEEKLEEDMFDK